MKTLPQDRMIEATRLTSQGRLDEAMGVLHDVLSGSRSPAASVQSADDACESEPVTIDMLPPSEETGTAWTSPPHGQRRPPERASQQVVPEALGAFLDGVSHFATSLGSVALSRGATIRAAPSPDEAKFEERTYANAAGRRTYKLYVPSGYHGQDVPLVVMLHGCTQSPDDFAAGTQMNDLAEEETFIVAYPAQSQSANVSKCWSWFNAEHHKRDHGEPSLIAGLTREIMREFSVDARRVYVAGLSAGGAAAAILGHAYPDLFAAVGVHSGLARGAASDMNSAYPAMQRGASPAKLKSLRDFDEASVPTIIVHGDRDMIVRPINGQQLVTQSQAGLQLEATITQGESQDGVRYTRSVWATDAGRPWTEYWVLHGAGHAWSGGSAAGSYTEPRGPDASRAMMRFFLQQPGPRTS